MKKSLLMLVAAIACSTTLAYAADKHEKNTSSLKNDHEVAVGNEKAAASGSKADNKTVKPEKTQADHQHKKGDHEHKKGDQKHEKADHDLTVGNEKAAESGSSADDKTVKSEKAHSNQGKHKAKGKTKE